MTIFDLDPNIIRDETELGLRVAVSLFVENKTKPENFIQILKFKARHVRM